MNGFTPIQMGRLRRFLPLLALAVLPASTPAQTREWVFHKTADGSHPDGNEQELVWLMNRARANPAAEGRFLANHPDPSVQLGLSYFGVDVNLMQQEFSAIPPKPPAAFDRRLYAGSLAHSLDLIRRQAQDHTGQLSRLNQAGFYYLTSHISTYSYGAGPPAVHGALNIDWGPGPGNMQSGRGHRQAIMSNTPAFLSNVGFAMVPENNSATAIGPWVFSGAYAHASPARPDHYNRFLVGTMWTDRNGNGRYDAGEGHDQIRVQPSHGSWHAVTGKAGGWAIPADPGNYTVTFSGPGLPVSFTRQVTVGNDSVLLDTPTAPPFEVSIRPAQGGMLTLSWSGGKPPYQVQWLPEGTRQWQNLGTPVNSSSISVKPAGPRALYRVMAAP